MIVFSSSRKMFLTSLCVFGLFFVPEVLAATNDGPAGAGGGSGAAAVATDPSHSFVYDKEKYESYYEKNDLYRSFGYNGWQGVVRGIANDRDPYGPPLKEGDLSSVSFHRDGLSWTREELNEWFRRGLLPSIIFSLTGVVNDNKYAVGSEESDYLQQLRNAARVFYITAMSGKYLGWAFTFDKDKAVANVFGEKGMSGLGLGKTNPMWGEINKKIFAGFGKYPFAQPILNIPNPLLLDHFPGNSHFLMKEEDPLMHRDSPAFDRAQYINRNVNPLFKDLSTNSTLLETAYYFHRYKLKEEQLENERDGEGGFESWDGGKKKRYNEKTTHIAHITNALQYYIFKYIQEKISHALTPGSYAVSPPCVEEENYRALMEFVRSDADF